MINLAEIPTEFVSSGFYTDSHQRQRSITHSRVCCKEAKEEIKRRVAEELFFAFLNPKK
ncbi:hypothetical protein [Anaerotruncus colihominis]|uniref:hypothetical protein n=1 Tax=Anaerotruncus colihominis TaxID=169435 RepID=UPI00174A4B91|nr:hypothetical protein [Anaerotruncus colihominis]